MPDPRWLVYPMWFSPLLSHGTCMFFCIYFFRKSRKNNAQRQGLCFGLWITFCGKLIFASRQTYHSRFVRIFQGFFPFLPLSEPIHSFILLITFRFKGWYCPAYGHTICGDPGQSHPVYIYIICIFPVFLSIFTHFCKKHLTNLLSSAFEKILRQDKKRASAVAFPAKIAYDIDGLSA